MSVIGWGGGMGKAPRGTHVALRVKWGSEQGGLKGGRELFHILKDPRSKAAEHQEEWSQWLA